MIAGKSKTELVLRGLELAVIGMAALHVVLFALAVLHRIGSPFPFEWVEHLAASQALSMARGNPVYGPPTMDIQSAVYAPGLAYVLLAGHRLGLPIFYLGRVISVGGVLLACVFLYRTVRREGGSRTMAWLAVGLFLASYFATGRNYDMARVDPGAIGLLAAGLYYVTRDEKLSRATWLGVLLLCAATYFKQNVALICVASLAALALVRRRAGLYALGGYLVIVVGIALLLDARTGGWFRYWCWTLPASHPLWPHDRFGGSGDYGALIRQMLFAELPAGTPALFLVGVLAAAVVNVVARLRAASTRLVDLALVVVPLAAFVAGAAGRMKTGGWVNGWSLVFFACALCAPLMVVQARRFAERRGVSRRARVACYAALLVYAAVALYQRRYNPLSGRPMPRARVHLARYAKLLRSIGAPVFAPYLPVVTELHGGGPQVMFTYLIDQAWAGKRLPPDFYRKRDRRHWKALFLPAGCSGWPPWLGQLGAQYVPVTPIKLPLMQPFAEMAHHWIWLPRPDMLQPHGIELDFERVSHLPAHIARRFAGQGSRGWSVDVRRGVAITRGFRLRGDTVRFRWASGQHAAAAVELLVGDGVTHAARGDSAAQRVVWDVSAQMGQRVRLRVRDPAGRFAHLVIDGLFVSYERRRLGQRPSLAGYVGWVARGIAFGPGPARGTLPGQLRVTGYRGKRLASSFHGGDPATGSLTSERFVLRGDTISFLVGGSRRVAAFELLVEGRVMQRAHGQDSEHLRRVAWDVAPFRGKWVQLRARDWGGGPFGHLLLDDIVIVERPAGLPFWGDARILEQSQHCSLPSARFVYDLNY
ncbi:MAG: hypothetical protein KC503_20490 [Myxococcales bacterium]|nr:hypothetical protein [Myxococcales bacterium]